MTEGRPLHTVFTDRPFQDLYGARVLLPKRDVHLEEFEVLLEALLRRERGAVEALQHRPKELAA